MLVEGGVQARGVHVLVRHGWEQKLGLKETFFPIFSTSLDEGGHVICFGGSDMMGVAERRAFPIY